MAYLVEQIVSRDWPQAGMKNGSWVKARPLTGPFLWRLRDAWGVLIGKYDAVVWTTNAAFPPETNDGK
jgi:hypothetical protein